MDFYKVIENRTSNKSFTNEPIPKDSLDRIINAALMSPSWKNKTCYSFIFVNDPTQKDEIAQTILNDTNEASNSVKQSPLVAIIVADPSQSGMIDDKSYYMVDCGIAMEHLVLASTNEGLGTCWIGAFDEKKLRKLLNVPNEYKIVALSPIGKTSELPVKEPAKDISQHIYYNNWGETNQSILN